MKGKDVPYSFILDELVELDLTMKPMFGCYAFYKDEKLLFILRKKSDHTNDNGVWIATNSAEDRIELRKKIKSLRSLELFGTSDTAWQNIPEESVNFESEVTTACDLMKKGSPLIGKIPAKKKKSAVRSAAPSKMASSKKTVLPKKTLVSGKTGVKKSGSKAKNK